MCVVLSCFRRQLGIVNPFFDKLVLSPSEKTVQAMERSAKQRVERIQKWAQCVEDWNKDHPHVLLDQQLTQSPTPAATHVVGNLGRIQWARPNPKHTRSKQTEPSAAGAVDGPVGPLELPRIGNPLNNIGTDVLDSRYYQPSSSVYNQMPTTTPSNPPQLPSMHGNSTASMCQPDFPGLAALRRNGRMQLTSNNKTALKREDSAAYSAALQLCESQQWQPLGSWNKTVQEEVKQNSLLVSAACIRSLLDRHRREQRQQAAKTVTVSTTGNANGHTAFASTVHAATGVEGAPLPLSHRNVVHGGFTASMEGLCEGNFDGLQNPSSPSLLHAVTAAQAVTEELEASMLHANSATPPPSPMPTQQLGNKHRTPPAKDTPDKASKGGRKAMCGANPVVARSLMP